MKEPLQEIRYKEIRELYLNAPATRGIKPEWKPMDRDKVLGFLVGEHSFSRERVEAAISRVQSSKTTPSETLEKWFG